jgi:hypothetical protein
MSAHKFTVGQTARFLPDRYHGGAGPGSFKIARLLPETASVLRASRTVTNALYAKTN